VGENADGTKSALGTAFPALLGSLVGKVNSSPNGAGEIFNAIKQGTAQGGWSDSISNVISGLSGGAPQGATQSLLGSLLGSKLGPVADFIASRSGIRGSSAMSLLGMAAPFLMGTIGKHVSSQGLDANGLGQLLGSQSQYLKDVLPSGLANTLGIGKLLSASPEAQKAEAAAGARATQPAQAAYRPGETHPVEAARSGGILKWAWVPLLLALAGWFAINRSHRTEMGGTSENYGMNTGRTYSMPAAPNPSQMQVTPGGIADNLSKAIASGDYSKTIDLQGFTTDANGALTESGKAGIREIGKVLAGSPNVKIQIVGHGDTDEAGMSRANAIKSALIAVGVSEDRISTSGDKGMGAPTVHLMH
jgi:outer membrane protein OmpA-like peptidoglycan-associated protein